MKAYNASGSFRAGKKDQKFSVEVVAKDKDEAIERVFSNFGSRHRVSRRFILIDEVNEIDPSNSTSPSVQAHFGSTGKKISNNSGTEEE
jgi:large subunit ribosomal protein LX|tara:strand:+ start:6685 stop:6951 length:267 start_codon:yes stop_codon:yes gene_type:complete